MAYKIISTVLTDSDTSTEGLDAAIALAARLDTHLEIFVVTICHSETNTYYMGTEALNIERQTRDAMAERIRLDAWVNDRMQGEPVRWALQSATVQGPALTAYLARKLRFSDLVVLPRPYQDNPDAEALVEACLFSAERPVLMIPKGCKAPDAGGHVLMGWNDGAEALAAARAALPLLQQADVADICIIDPPMHAADRSDPGGAMAQYLMRHGTRSEVAVLAKTEPHVGEILLRRAREVGAQLIISGAYGHSRLREAVFGGATRSLLEQADRPILMSR
ncbi:universal stress protein [Yoonia vestfoldensis]|uniref:Universal stress protein family protein n=1 Tax=Yoonia vestfoldensis TaxID=245188 RepID=A0A1Y0E9B7_9RHOB|nr:universal stress protein [Yoonia vestfoldensis]ART99961.1 universal stress protein family protein [Yoonia vestfoldensis]